MSNFHSITPYGSKVCHGSVTGVTMWHDLSQGVTGLPPFYQLLSLVHWQSTFSTETYQFLCMHTPDLVWQWPFLLTFVNFAPAHHLLGQPPHLHQLLTFTQVLLNCCWPCVACVTYVTCLLCVRVHPRPGTCYVQVLMELWHICRMGTQGDRSLLDAWAEMR